MAGQSITFDFLTTGADRTASGFRKVGDNTFLAAKGAKILSDAIETLGKKEDRTAAESVILAKALKQTGDAEDRVAAKAVLADAAIRRLDDAMQDTSKHSGELSKTLGGLKLNPGLVGPLLALAPAIATLGGVGAGAAAGLGGAFIAGGAALAAFGAVAKPVLSDAKTAATAVEKAQNNYTAAIAGGTKKSVAYKAEQIAIAKAYANLSPAQIQLSKQLGGMASAWDAVKAAQTPVVAGALQPWLKSVTGLTSALGPIIAEIAPVIASLGGQFNNLVNSSAFKGFRDFIGSTGSAAVSAGGSTIIDLVKSFMILLPKFDPLIREAVGWISRLGPAVLSWASSKKAADQIQSFLQWFSQNGPVVGGLLKNIGGALKALAPGLASGGALELKVISDFLGLVAKLPPAIAKPLTEVAGAALILSKLGVLKVGLQIVGPAVKWLTGGLINLGGGAAAGTEIRAAMVSGGAAAAAEIRAAMAGGGAVAGGAGAAAGGAGAGAAGGTAAGGGFVAAFRAALSPALAGVVAGALIRAAGDTLSPAGSFAGRLNAQFQADGHLWSTSLLHSFTFGGLEGWMTAHFGQPVGGFLNKTTGFLTGSWGKFTGFLSGSWNQTWAEITGRAAQGSKSVGDSLAAAGRSADALRTRNLIPLQGQFGKVTGGIQGLAGTIQGTMLNALRAAGAKSDAIRTQNLVPLRGELGRVSGGVQGLQRSIDNLHGKNIQIHMNGQGLYTITGSVIAASQGKGGSGNAAGGLAAGGFISGGTPGRDSVFAALMPGEVVVPTRMVKAGAVDHLRGQLPGFASGGQVSGNLTPGFISGMYSSFQNRMTSAEISAMRASLKTAEAAARAAAAAAAAGGGPGGGAGVARWAGVILQALSLIGQPASWLNTVERRMNQESGGNPNIVNKWDSNWLAGHPSVGLMQVIAGTFASYAGRFRNTGPFEYGVSVNPLANTYAGLNYALHTYGSLSALNRPGGYAQGGLVQAMASGGQVGKQGAAWLKAWQSRHGGGFGAAWGPKVLNEQIPEMAAAVQRAKALSGASGLSPGQHRFWAATAKDETRRLAVLGKELTTERAWRTQLGLGELGLDKEIRAAGNLKSLAGPVRGWKAQLGRDKARITAISKMLGYSDAYIKAHPAPKPGPVLPTITHTYGGDVVNSIAPVLAAALGPFTGAARGGMVWDRGGVLRPGWNPPMYNATGRPEPLVPARGGGGQVARVELEITGGDQELVTLLRKIVKVRGGGSAERAFGSR